MQIIAKCKVKNYGSCNFCARGVLGEDGKGMVYPYDTVNEIRGETGPTINMCDECLLSLVKAISHLSKYTW